MCVTASDGLPNTRLVANLNSMSHDEFWKQRDEDCFFVNAVTTVCELCPQV